jgi:hypothetical protein
VFAVAVFFVLALASGIAQQARAAGSAMPVVVELFTSQGCSSCPPADKLLGELATRSDVIALSMPVDYWDYLDWQDTLGRSEHTERQRQYVERLGLATVYTPQMIVSGLVDVIGSRAEAVEDAIREVRNKLADSQVALTVEERDKTIHIEVAAGGAASPATATIYAVPILSKRTVNIERGENRGKTITYHNVSREIMPVGTWTGKAQTLDLAHDEIMIGDTDHCVVILQDDRTGAILGAALL